jgi:hypothetical protein
MAEAISKKDLLGRLQKDLPKVNDLKNKDAKPVVWTGAGKDDYGYTGYQGHGMPTDKQERELARKKKGVAEAQTDYQKRRQRERDVDAGKPVSRQPKNPQTDYARMRAKQKRDQELGEKKDRSPGKITKSEDPCWTGYHMVGKKKKNGREVPNCVPGKKG